MRLSNDCPAGQNLVVVRSRVGVEMSGVRVSTVAVSSVSVRVAVRVPVRVRVPVLVREPVFLLRPLDFPFLLLFLSFAWASTSVM